MSRLKPKKQCENCIYCIEPTGNLNSFPGMKLCGRKIRKKGKKLHVEWVNPVYYTCSKWEGKENDD